MHGRPDPVPPSPQVASLLSGAASAHPHAVAAVHEGRTVTYEQISASVERLADVLAVAPGERVAVVAPNTPALVCGLFATWRAGAVAVPLSARLRRFELERAFADAQPTSAVSVASHTGFALGEEIRALAERVPSLRSGIVVDDVGNEVRTWHSRQAERVASSAAELAAILYTSGTTGEAKGALVSHALAVTMANNIRGLLASDASAPYGLVVPASHAFGLGCMLCGVSAGATAIMVEVASTVEPLMHALRVHEARVLHGTPALFARVRRAREETPVRGGLVAGSFCPPDLLRALDDRGIRLLNVYGLTEIGAGTSCRREDPPNTRYGTVGRALDGYEVRVVGGGEQESLPGEIQVRSEFLADGYLGRPWTSTELADGEWFHTGDLGGLDADGNLTIAGRAKELVHVGGFNVFPAEVESFLLTHPGISQAAVVGVSHPALGEALQAFVVPAEEATLKPRDVVAFARGGIAGYKVPYSVEIVEQLPALPSGKPDRRALARGEVARHQEVLH